MLFRYFYYFSDFLSLLAAKILQDCNSFFLDFSLFSRICTQQNTQFFINFSPLKRLKFCFLFCNFEILELQN
jgi:hypothetical protein